MPQQSKQERIEARLSAEDSYAIADAAVIEGVSKSSFVVTAAVERANSVLRDHRLTVVAWEHAENLLNWLDRPAQVIPELKRLADAPAFDHR